MATVHENFVAVQEFLTSNGASEDLVDFINTRIAQEDKARETAKAKRLEKNGGVKKDPAQSEFYTSLRDSIKGVMTTSFLTGDELVSKCGAVTASGKPVLAAQVATALKPLIADGSVVVGDVKVTITGKDGLKKETYRKGYKFA